MTHKKKKSAASDESRKDNDVKTSNVSKTLQLLVVIKNFCTETSVHGLGQVVKHSVAIAKVVWLVVFFAAVIGNAYHISTLVVMYLDYPVQEVTKSQHDPITFPGVTVCNLDAISRSNYDQLLQNKSSRLAQYLGRVQDMFDSGIITDEEADEYKTVTSIQINIGMEESMFIGHQIKDMILKCRFRGKACNITERFKLIMNPLLYNCYTFDPGDTGDSYFATGPENGLSLIFYLEANNGTKIHAEYDVELNSANAMGLKVMLHPRHVYPTPQIDGMDIMPGHSTSIAFKVTRTKKLPPPFGHCISNETLKGMAGYVYSTTPCLNLCLQQRFIDICRCKSVHQPVPDSVQNEEYCGRLTDGEDIDKIRNKSASEDLCRTKVWLEFIASQRIRGACGCRPRCSDYFYTYTVTESSWPASKYHVSFIEHEILNRKDRSELKAFTQLKSLIGENFNSSHDHTSYAFVADNFARLNVYLRDQESLLREQQASYELSKLFSDIGGTLGLWVGLSLLTLIELLQLAVRTLLVMSGKRVA